MTHKQRYIPYLLLPVIPREDAERRLYGRYYRQQHTHLPLNLLAILSGFLSAAALIYTFNL